MDRAPRLKPIRPRHYISIRKVRVAPARRWQGIALGVALLVGALGSAWARWWLPCGLALVGLLVLGWRWRADRLYNQS